jgi:hypothetical protein
VKSFFPAKTSCEYTMNYLRQEKCLRDHGSTPSSLGGLMMKYPDLVMSAGGRIALSAGGRIALSAGGRIALSAAGGRRRGGEAET